MPDLFDLARPVGAAAGRQVARLAEAALSETVRLAVTGLAQSGKTVFTTALVHSLLVAKRHPALLPFFGVVNSGRYLDAALLPPRRRKPFPYAESIARLTAEPPQWPPSTTGISELRLAIEYRPAGLAGRLLTDTAAVTLVIVDYPGEWLLDLPLLRKSFREWSDDMLALCRRPPRDRLAAGWLAVMKDLAPDRPAAAEDLARAGESYRAFLLKCRASPPGLSFVQPGRFVVPGDDLPDPALLHFCPLPPPASGRAKRGSLHAAMEERYEAYRKRIVAPFYRDHFRRFDRQIVLVDVLTALNTGYDAFIDAQQALLQVMESFRYGRSGLLARLFGARIDKVLFAATKADHITVNQYNNLRLLLQAMVTDQGRRTRFEGAEVEFGLAAALKCTQPATLRFQGRTVAALRGVPRGSAGEQVLYPGEIPGEFPTPADWDEDRFRFVDFEPPRLSDAMTNGIRSIYLDKALEFLLGDKFA